MTTYLNCKNHFRFNNHHDFILIIIIIILNFFGGENPFDHLIGTKYSLDNE